MMAQYPRRITRGVLKGTYVESERDYRRKLAEKTGVSRYARRKKRAQALGYTGYTERRKVLKRLRGDKAAERRLLEQAQDTKERDVLLAELERFQNTSREERIRSLMDEANRLGISVHLLYQRLYQVVDTRGLRSTGSISTKGFAA